jgi:hypothetical protein
MRARFALLALLLATAAHAQAPSPAQMGITSTTTPEVLQTLDSTKTWVPLGTVDPTNHVWSGFGAGTDVRTFGCKADGSDQTACINNALTSALDCVIIPATQNGFTVNGVLTVQRCLRGTTWTPSAPFNGWAGGSFLNCNNQTAQPCVVFNGISKKSAQIANLSIVGTGGTPVDGSTGFQLKGGQNFTLTNVQIVNFGSCAYLGPTATNQIEPIAFHSYNLLIGQCHKHYVVNDGTPEAYFIGGRWGVTGDYDTADDYLFSTRTANAGAGGGPNTLVISSVQINGGSAGCVFRWGGMTGTGGTVGSNKISNTHVELLGNNYTGSASRGFFCTDSTVARAPQLQVSNNDFADDGPTTKSLPAWNYDPATAVANISAYDNNVFGNAATTLSVHNLANFGPVIRGNSFASRVTFNATDTSAVANVSDNDFDGNYTISGQWLSLGLSNNKGVLTDTATGHIYAVGDPLRGYTPTLTFGGAATGITYSTQTGFMQRTGDGGYQATISLGLTSKGTAVGVAQINNLPYVCSLLPSMSTPVLSNMTGLTGVVHVQVGSGGSVAFPVQTSATGNNTSLTDAAFTNTSSLSAVIKCGMTQ